METRVETRTRTRSNPITIINLSVYPEHWTISECTSRFSRPSVPPRVRNEWYYIFSQLGLYFRPFGSRVHTQHRLRKAAAIFLNPWTFSLCFLTPRHTRANGIYFRTYLLKFKSNSVCVHILRLCSLTLKALFAWTQSLRFWFRGVAFIHNSTQEQPAL